MGRNYDVFCDKCRDTIKPSGDRIVCYEYKVDTQNVSSKKKVGELCITCWKEIKNE